jgi:tetratricopeptide (TPR) repeat protein
MKLYLAGLITLFSSVLQAQTDLADTLQSLYRSQNYDAVIKFKPKKGQELSAKAFYFKGMAHYMKSEDAEAMKYFDMAIQKGPADYDMYYYKGMLLYYAKKYEEAIPLFDKAIAMLPDEPDFYIGKGDSYYSLGKRDSAAFYLEKAAALPHCKTRAFRLLGNLYEENKSYGLALDNFQKALALLTPEDEDYQDCSYNVGLTQLMLGNGEAAKTILEKHVSQFPADYHAVAKLIQAYYNLGEFDKAVPYKKVLYEKHAENKLTDGMKKMFCFDQFSWNGKRVMAFENFDEPNETNMSKHHFYVTGDSGKIDFKIDSETSEAVKMSGANNKYVLCLVKNEVHYTYWQYVFNDDYKYPELKAAVLAILDDKVRPGASFQPAKKD